MKHYLYILESKKLNKFYVGETQNIEFRIELHTNKVFSKAFTTKASDWEKVLCWETANKEEAVFLEKFIKRMKSKKFILKIIDKPEILNDILSKK